MKLKVEPLSVRDAVSNENLLEKNVINMLKPNSITWDISNYPYHTSCSGRGVEKMKGRGYG